MATIATIQHYDNDTEILATMYTPGIFSKAA